MESKRTFDKETATVLVKQKLKSPEKVKRIDTKSHNTKENKSNLKYSCKLCSRSFSQNSLLLKHELIHNGKPLCVTSKDNVKTVTTICKFCNEQFDNNDTYQMHVRLHLKKMNMIKKSVMSKKQHKNTKTQTLKISRGGSPLNRTNSIKSPKSINQIGNPSQVEAERKNKNVKVEKTPSSKGHKCHICNRVFRDMISCNKHTRLHLRVMPYKCNKCGVYCRMWGQFKNHVSTAHPECTFSEALDLNHQVKSMAMETEPDQEQYDSDPNDSVFIDANNDLKNEDAPKDSDVVNIDAYHIEENTKTMPDELDAGTVSQPELDSSTDEIPENSTKQSELFEAETTKAQSAIMTDTDILNITDEILNNSGEMLNISDDLMKEFENQSSQTSRVQNGTKSENLQDYAMTPPVVSVFELHEYKSTPPLHLPSPDSELQKFETIPSTLSIHSLEDKESNQTPPPVSVHDLHDNEAAYLKEGNTNNKGDDYHGDEADCMLDNDCITDNTSSVTLPSYQASETSDTTYQGDPILQGTPKYYITCDKESEVDYPKLQKHENVGVIDEDDVDFYNGRHILKDDNGFGIKIGTRNYTSEDHTVSDQKMKNFTSHFGEPNVEDTIDTNHEESIEVDDVGSEGADDVNSEIDFDDTLVLLESSSGKVNETVHPLDHKRSGSYVERAKHEELSGRDSNIVVVRVRKETTNSSIISPIIQHPSKTSMLSDIPTTPAVPLSFIKHSTPRFSIDGTDKTLEPTSRNAQKYITPKHISPKPRQKVTQPKVKNSNSKDPKLFHCHICGRDFNDLVIFRAHKQTHPDCLTHVCSECGWQFSSEEILQVHMEKHIFGEHNIDNNESYHDSSHDIVTKQLDAFYRSNPSKGSAETMAHGSNTLREAKRLPNNMHNKLKDSGNTESVNQNVNQSKNGKHPQNGKHSQNGKHVKHSTQGEHIKYSEIVSSFLKDGKINAESILHILKQRKEIFRCDDCSMVFTDSKSYVTHRGLHDLSSDFLCSVCNFRFKGCEEYVSHFIVHHKL